MWSDLQFALRMLRRSPLFALVAIAVVAIGVGANAAVFSVFDAWLLRPLPYQEPARLFSVWRGAAERPQEPSMFATYPDLAEWRRQGRNFTDMAGYFWRRFVLTGVNEPEELLGEVTTTNFFETLGVRAEVGRTFTQQQDGESAPVAVLSYGLWQRRFGGAESVLGRSILLNGEPHTIVGVMPNTFLVPAVAQSRPVDVWVPFPRGELGPVGVIGRLKDGAGVDQVRAELSVLQMDLDKRARVPLKNMTVVVDGLQDDLSRTLRPALRLLLGAVGFVLLISCANVAGLLLGRTGERRKELAVRAAVGSGRLRLIRQLLTESLLLAVLGGLAGLALAHFGLRLILSAQPFETPPLHPIGLDWRVLAFSIGLTGLTGLLFGIIPAVDASRIDLNDLLKQSSRGNSSRGEQQTRGWLVAGEVALSTVLLSGAALMVMSFDKLATTPLGFQHEQAVAVRLALQGLPLNEQAGLFDRVIDRMRQLPGVQAASITSVLPLSTPGTTTFTVQGRTLPPEETALAARQSVSSDYFATLRIPMLRGRTFEDTDRENKEGVVIINQTLAERYFGADDPVGSRIKLGPPNWEGPFHTVVGVVASVKFSPYNTLDWRVRPEIYLPHWYVSRGGDPFGRTAWITVRTQGDATTVAPAIRRELQQLNRSVPIAEVKTMREVLAESIAQTRLRTVLMTAFALAALLLAAVGLYGVLAQAASVRRHEISIRLAVGATPGDILRMMLSGGLRFTLLGAGAGIVAALLMGRFLEGLLFGVSATDPLVLAGVVILMVLVAFVASFIPVWRVARMNPMEALRHE